MKRILPLLLLFITPALAAQVRKIETGPNVERSGSEMSVRAKTFYENSALSADNAPWSRVIYRELDLTQESNASLYFPEEPMEGQTNLFRLIINLMTENKLTAYEYLDGRELFTSRYELNVKDMLDKFHILYEEKPARGSKSTPQFTIDESDIPCNEVQSYYIKEKWVFDQQGSMFFSQVDAICPILHRSGDFGGDVTKYPMFWIPYETIRPYLTQHRVMSAGMNNTLRYTFHDFFVMRQYKGDIYKTMNLRNQSLMQQYPHPDSLKIAREKIEQDLQRFEKGLWVPRPEEAVKGASKSVSHTPDGEASATSKEPSAAPERTIHSTRRTNPREKVSEPAASKSSSGSTKSSGSAPVRSVRRTR